METKKEVAASEQPDTQTSLSSVTGPEKSSKWAYLKHYFTSRDGWVGDYVRPFPASPLGQASKPF